MRIVFKTIAILLLGLAISPALVAKQTHFKKQSLGHEIRYTHSFASRDGYQYRLNFALNADDVAQSSQRFTRQSRDNLSKAIKQRSTEIFDAMQEEYLARARVEFDQYINDEAAKLPAGITILNEDQGRNIKASSDGTIPTAVAEQAIENYIQRMQQKWQELNEQYLDQFEDDVYALLRKHYADEYKAHQFVTKFDAGQKLSYTLLVDFIEVINQQRDKLRPVSEAIERNTKSKSMRKRINFVLNFMQSIPYDTLQSRNAAGEIGFVEPVTLFDINRGDCDTKSTAMAAILKNMFPDLKMILVLVPNHAFLAVAVPKQPGDHYLRYEGEDYLIVEAAGPALTPLGKAYPSTRQHINNDKYIDILPVI